MARFLRHPVNYTQLSYSHYASLQLCNTLDLYTENHKNVTFYF